MLHSIGTSRTPTEKMVENEVRNEVIKAIVLTKASGTITTLTPGSPTPFCFG